MASVDDDARAIAGNAFITMTHVHEFQQVIWLATPLGEGVALLHIDYGVQHNGTLLVALEDGELKYFDTNQVKLLRNDTLEIGVQK